MSKKKKLSTEDLLAKHDPFESFDLSKIGNDKDPCFGKGYNLTTKECKMCGDSELCCFQMSQLLGKTRKQLEKENKFKDLDILEDTQAIKKYIRSIKRKGLSRKEIVSKASIKFEVPTNIIRKLYKELK